MTAVADVVLLCLSYVLAAVRNPGSQISVLIDVPVNTFNFHWFDIILKKTFVKLGTHA